MQKKSPLELDQAKRFMRLLVMEHLSPIDEPDCSQPSRPGGHPDFIFRDSKGHEYVLELTRLLPRELRELEKFVQDNICTPLDNEMPGTYVLEVPADPLGRGRVTPEVARRCLEEIHALAQNATLAQTQQLGAGFILSKVRDDGSKLVPWIAVQELAFDLAPDDPMAKGLAKEFEKVVCEANSKFSGYRGTRTLVISLSQSALDWEFHSRHFKDGKGIMLTWVESISYGLDNVDFIYLDPSVRVWRGERRVLAGHKYVDARPGHYIPLWQRQRETSPRV